MGSEYSHSHWGVSKHRNLKLNGSLKREELSGRPRMRFSPSFDYEFIVGNMNKNENSNASVAVRLLIMHAAYMRLH